MGNVQERVFREPSGHKARDKDGKRSSAVHKDWITMCARAVQC